MKHEQDPRMSHSPEDTRRIAAQLARRLQFPAVIALAGPLGAGKTEFVKGVAAALGIKRPIQSPTFVLHKSYPFRKNRKLRYLAHLDLYRIRGQNAIADLNLAELLADKDRIVMIEWPQTIKKLLPKKTLFIKFFHGKAPNQRIITTRRGC